MQFPQRITPDRGDEFTYTGSGGRDLSGNKRIGEHSFDQTLTHMNRALALNCDAPLNDKDGAESRNWREGKPVRVVRSSKGRRISKYAPEEGNRYDGIYKVVKYWPEIGKCGFLTCLQRSFRAEVYTCPACRHDLGKDYAMNPNKTLQVLLDQFFPGYSKGR
ncbi:hypothetical protein CRUP_020644 [Coryphaenoides rupestris]|nr:hypothetical protein CRUP_020644 [Coryphaenoides rupestris]